MAQNKIFTSISHQIKTLKKNNPYEYEETFMKILQRSGSQHSISKKYLIDGFFLNTFALNRLNGKLSTDNIKNMFEKRLLDLIQKSADSYKIISLLGKILRQETHPSWLNNEKQRVLHRIIEWFVKIFRNVETNENKKIIIDEIVNTFCNSCPTVTVDVRGQAADLFIQLFEDGYIKNIDIIINKMGQEISAFKSLGLRDEKASLFEWHDTIDPHPLFPDKNIVDILWNAASYKVRERAFTFTLRVLQKLNTLNKSLNVLIDPILDNCKDTIESLNEIRYGVLSSDEFESFIAQRLPSKISSIEDYIVNRHQVLTESLTIHEICRWLIAAPENASSDRRNRMAISAFYRQIFAIGETCNPGLEGRPFFIDHGYSETGERLDWPSYVFIPAGAIWGKGAGVDLSCGVAIGGGVNLNENKGRDGAYIGGSWTSTLYHGHSHVGGKKGTSGAGSRDRIVYYGLTVKDGKRLPWGEFVDAEDHVNGDVYPGVRTYPLTPKVNL